jgi:acyl-CoA thioesterase
MALEIADELKNSEILKRVLAGDRFVLEQGIKAEAVRPGYGKASLVVTEHHLNGVDIVQGGAVFTLADYAFALASNSHENIAVGIESNISFVKPSRVGDTLYAEAEELNRSKSLGSYLVRITNQQGELAAVFYGRAFFRQERK